MSEDAKIAYSKKRTEGFYDTKVKVTRAQLHFEELLNNKKESVDETGK